MGFRVATDFDGGALGPIESLTENRLRAAIPRDWDQDRFNTQATWYYFRLDGLAGRPAEVVLTGLGSVYNGRPSPGGIIQDDQPVVSDDQRTWRKLTAATFDEAARTYTIPLEPTGDRLWVAALEPYVAADLESLRLEVQGHPELRVETCGRSVEGRPIELWSIGAEEAATSAWVIARQHAWETHTSFCMEGLVRWLLSDEAREVRRRCVFKLLPLVDPDGVVAGASRFNRLGYDTNRHWDETEPGNPEHRRLRPEICAAKEPLLAWLAGGRQVALHLNLHDTQVDYMAAVPALSAHPVLRGVYQRLCEARFSGPLRLGDSLSGTAQVALYHELGIPAALIELGTARLPTYGDFPTAADRVRFGADLGRAIAATV
ncbi:MAG: hypothetical protein HUU35_14210 [Armatimonadetes bacterium]|nr:hypothetical protein [Armatimonadota bacterium]